RPGTRPGAVGGAVHARQPPRRAFAARLLPARRRHRGADRLLRGPYPRRRQLLGAPGHRDPARPGDLLLRGLVPGPRERPRAPVADAGGAAARGHRAEPAASARGAGDAADQGAALARPDGAVRVPPRLSARRAQAAEAAAVPAGLVPPVGAGRRRAGTPPRVARLRLRLPP